VSRPVTPEEHAARLEAVLAEADPAVGLFGPDTVVWRVSRHLPGYLLSTPLGAFMDTAHPWVAQGVAEHSTLFADPRRRARHTYLLLMRLVFGDADTVRRTSRALWSLHSRVEGRLPEDAGRFRAGSAYLANEVSALLWVHLVFFWTRLTMYEALVAPLDVADRDRYVQESARFAACFGVPDDVLPTSYDDFEALVRGVLTDGTLAASASGTRTTEFLRSQVPAPARAPFEAFVVEMLPPEVTRPLGLPERTRRTRVLNGAVLSVLRVATRLGPRSSRYVPAYLEAQHRLGGPPVPAAAQRLSARLVGRGTTLPTPRPA
jgi:uncharacterized protein (DUF2236 family)